MGETVKELIHDNLMEAGNSEREIFTLIFQMLIDEKGSSYTLKPKEKLIIGRRGPQLTEEEYFALFGRHLEQNAVDQYQYDMEQALVDSVCVYTQPKLSREDLIKIVKGNENSEIKNLFNTCLEKLNEKFKTQEDVRESKIKVQQSTPQQQQVQVQPQPAQDHQAPQQQPAPQSAQGQAPQQPQVQPAQQGPVTPVVDNQQQPVQQKKQEEAKEAETPEEDRLKIYYDPKDDHATYIDNTGKKISDVSAKELGNAILVDRDPKTQKVTKTYKSFKDIFEEKYVAILNKNQKDESNENKNQEESSSEDQSNDGQSNKPQLGTSFLEIITNEPGIKILTTTGLRLKGIEEDGKIVYGKKQISELNAYKLKVCIVTNLSNIIDKENEEKNGKTNIKFTKDGEATYYPNQTIKNWIEENIVINGKKASVEDVVTKVVEILGIKNELDAEFAIKDSTNPAILVKALESNAELKDALKDNIKEIKNIVKEKGLKAGYGYISALHEKIEPLLTNEQKEIFDSLLKTKTLIEKKAANVTIGKQSDTPAITEAGAKLLESKFRKMGLYKPADLINSPLNESVKLICDAAASEGPQAAVIKYIPYLLKEANDENCLTQDQITALADICKKFDKEFNISQISNVDKEACDSIAMAIFEVGCKKLAKKAEKNAEKKGKNDSKKSEKDKKNAAKKFGKALKKAKLKKELIAKLEGTFKQNNEQKIIHDELNDFVKKEQIRKDNGNSSLTDEQFKALKEAVNTYITATGGAEAELLPDDTQKQVNEPAEKQSTPVQEQTQPQQVQNGTEGSTIAEPSVSSGSTGTETTQEVNSEPVVENKKTLQEQIKELGQSIILKMKDKSPKELSIEEITNLQESYEQYFNCLQQEINFLENKKASKQLIDTKKTTLGALVEENKKYNSLLEITKLEKQLEEAKKQAAKLNEGVQQMEKTRSESNQQMQEILKERAEIEQLKEELDKIKTTEGQNSEKAKNLDDKIKQRELFLQPREVVELPEIEGTLKLIEEEENNAENAKNEVQRLTKELAKAKAEAERLAKEETERKAAKKSDAPKPEEQHQDQNNAEAEKRAKVQELTKQLKEAQKQAKGTQNEEVERLTEELVKVQNGQQTTKLGMLADTVYKRELIDKTVKESKKEFYKKAQEERLARKADAPKPANTEAEEEHNEPEVLGQDQAQQPGEQQLGLAALGQVGTPKLVETGDEISAPDNLPERTASKTQTAQAVDHKDVASDEEMSDNLTRAASEIPDPQKQAAPTPGDK